MRSRLLPSAIVLALAAVSCGSDDDSASATATATAETTEGATADDSPVDEVPADEAPTDESTTIAEDELTVEPGQPFPADRCAANEAAGTITFLTGFDFAAAASIVDVVAADAAGYYDELCLDVDIRAGFSSANYPQVASGTAQFASGGSFSEVVAFSAANDADFVAVSVEGRSAIDTLIVKPGAATNVPELDGSTIGVKGALPPAIDVMLRGEGLVEGENYDTVLLDGFDPLAHIAIPAIDGFPGWKSNEVGTLDRAGVGFQLFDPLDFGVPGSFGVIFTTVQFVEEHPTAAQDFVRATLKGLEDAVTDPDAAAAATVDLLTANGNPNFLSPEGEAFRWGTESALILDGTPEGMGLGVPDVEALQTETDTYSSVGYFGDGVMPDAGDYASDLASSVYGESATLIWPG
jgi:ABC-type nitrate/sulfonate/bicarbonate transport system substrate-binding protein